MFIERFEREALEQKALKAKSGPRALNAQYVTAVTEDLKASSELAGEAPANEEELF